MRQLLNGTRDAVASGGNAAGWLGDRRLRVLSLLILVGLGTPDVAGSQEVGLELVAGVDALFDDFNTHTPGASLVVVRQGRVIHRKGYGMADLEHAVPNSPGTVFDIASVSKQFTGMAVAMLVERGRIDLDAEVRSYLPELPDFGPSLTVRHLVHHISGVRDWPATLAIAGWRMDDVISFDQILRMAWDQEELNFPPGEEYSYSNTGYNLLAEIVSRVSGQSFRAWTDANIFGPLGMSNTHFQDDHRELVPNRAQGYSSAGRAYVKAPNGLTALGSSSLHSSVDDLAKWLVNYDGHEVGGRAVVERMRTQGVLNNGERIAYAYGLSHGSYRGRETWTHSGSWAGFRTYLVHFPELEFGIVILGNSGSYNPSGPAYRVADLFLEGELEAVSANPTAGGGAPSSPESAPQLSAVELQDYVGTYRSDELHTSYVLTVRDGRLVAIHARHGESPLEPTRVDGFRGSFGFQQPVRFSRDDSGRVTEMFVGGGRARNLRFQKL